MPGLTLVLPAALNTAPDRLNMAPNSVKTHEWAYCAPCAMLLAICHSVAVSGGAI